MGTLALALALLLPAATQDRTRVHAELSQETVRMGETVVLAITVETASGADIQIRMPQLASTLPVVGSQESSQVHYTIPGGRRRVVVRELVLQPASPGTFTIPQITVEVGGTPYRTHSLTLSVTGAAAPSPAMGGDEAWLRVSMSPETVYVGQQTTMTAEAGFSEEVRLRLTRPPIFDTPAPTGFWVQEIPGGVRSQLRPVNGRVVEVQTKQIAYFPLSAGRYALKQSRVIVDVRQGFLYAPETREIRSNSPRLTVLPLPETGRPTTFRGAVGRFTMQSSVEPLSVAAGEPVQIMLVVSGTGNVKSLSAPTLPQVLGAEVFAPTEESATSFERAVAGGTKTFTYVLIPDGEGVLKIPAITFTFFDPLARRYNSVQAEPVEVRVAASENGVDDETPSGVLRPLRVQPSAERLRWVRSPAFALLQLVPLLMLAALLLARRRTPRVNYAATYLSRVRATASLPNDRVYRELDRILREAMAEPAAHADVVAGPATQLIRRIHNARFAPVAPSASERLALTREAEQVVSALFEKSTAHAGAFAVVLLMALQAQPPAAGVQAYEAGDYGRAVALFSERAESTPRDASAWYNLGNAHYRAGETGRAIWAWAQALQIQPRSDDVVHNLQAAGNVEPIRVRPPLAVTAEEWWLLAALLWWTAVGFVIVALARHRRPTPWALAPLVLGLVFAIVGWRAAHAPPYAITLNGQSVLYSEPTVRSPTVRRVRAGAVLTVEEERGDWLHVRTIDRREAWVARDEVGLLTKD